MDIQTAVTALMSSSVVRTVASTRVQGAGGEPPNGVGCGTGLKRIGGV